MKALSLNEYKKLELTDLPEPDIGPEDVLVRVKVCGICGSDIQGYDGSAGRRIPSVVMGHEASGVVAATGAQVNRFHAGDRVTPPIACARAARALVGNIAPAVEFPPAMDRLSPDSRLRLLRFGGRISRLHRTAGARRSPRGSADQHERAAGRRAAWLDRLYSGAPNQMKVILQPWGR